MHAIEISEEIGGSVSMTPRKVQDVELLPSLYNSFHSPSSLPIRGTCRPNFWLHMTTKHEWFSWCMNQHKLFHTRCRTFSYTLCMPPLTLQLSCPSQIKYVEYFQTSRCGMEVKAYKACHCGSNAYTKCGLCSNEGQILIRCRGASSFTKHGHCLFMAMLIFSSRITYNTFRVLSN
jgi:hypothetical protein